VWLNINEGISYKKITNCIIVIKLKENIKCFRPHVDIDIFFFFWYVELVPKICPHLSVTRCMCS
jgi:hypothetical protein